MGADRPRLLAVTILTSMDQKAMREVGLVARRRAACEAGEASARGGGRWRGGFGAGSQSYSQSLRARLPDCDAGRTPERPRNAAKQRRRSGAYRDTDAKRSKQARTSSVVGRPIMAAADPRAAAQDIVDEIAAASKD